MMQVNSRTGLQKRSYFTKGFPRALTANTEFNSQWNLMLRANFYGEHYDERGTIGAAVNPSAEIDSTVYLDMERWCFGIGPQGIGVVGMLVNFTIALGLTPFCAPPTKRAQRMVESIREPEGSPQ